MVFTMPSCPYHILTMTVTSPHHVLCHLRSSCYHDTSCHMIYHVSAWQVLVSPLCHNHILILTVCPHVTFWPLVTSCPHFVVLSPCWHDNLIIPAYPHITPYSQFVLTMSSSAPMSCQILMLPHDTSYHQVRLLPQVPMLPWHLMSYSTDPV